MELLSVIRRWRHRDQISIWEIERRTGLSLNTIRKYLRSDAVEVRFKVPERPSLYISAVAGPRRNTPFQCLVVLISAEPRR